MHMVGHNDVGMQGIALAMEMFQCPGDGTIAIWSCEHASTMPSVKPFFHALLKHVCVFLSRRFIPWFGMGKKPCFSFTTPLGKQCRRHGICKTKCDEHNGTALSPVWKIVVTDIGFGIRREELLIRSFDCLAKFDGAMERRSYLSAAKMAALHTTAHPPPPAGRSAAGRRSRGSGSSQGR